MFAGNVFWGVFTMESFTLNITKELVDRLTGNEEKAKKRTRKPKPKVVPKEPRRPQTRPNEKSVHDESKPQKVPSAPGWPIQPPIFLPAPASAELDAIRSVVQESEKVLEKLQKQEEHMVQEVTERAKDLHGKEFKLPYQKPMPCVADYEACRSCYKEHVNDILRCSPLTKSYYECVQRVKRQAAASADK
ncbi:hypothetical protein LINPERPRIM_LOCUS35991 [Linum perenne]